VGSYEGALCLVQPFGLRPLQEELMNAKTVLFGATVFALASAALSINDTKFAANEYRWIVADGPYARPSKEDQRQVTKHHTDEAELQMVGQPTKTHRR
jgi:hypothetical protein